MIKQIAWNTFKKTGDINTYLEFAQINNIEKEINGEENVNDKNKWNYINGK